MNKEMLEKIAKIELAILMLINSLRCAEKSESSNTKYIKEIPEYLLNTIEQILTGKKT